jgi:hypothetical protein
MVIWENSNSGGVFDCYFSIGTIWHLPLELKDLKDVCLRWVLLLDYDTRCRDGSYGLKSLDGTS